MVIGSMVAIVSNVLCRPESFLISNGNLLLAVFFAHNCECCLLEGISNTVVSVSAEQVGINFASLDWVSANVGWVRSDFLCVSVGHQSRYIQLTISSQDLVNQFQKLDLRFFCWN